MVVHEAIEPAADRHEKGQGALAHEQPEEEEDDPPDDTPARVVFFASIYAVVDGDSKNNQRDNKAKYGDHGSSRI